MLPPLPPPLPEAERAPLPVAAVLAPVVAGVLLAGVTGSPLPLVFAAFGPVMALASLLDGRRHSRRRRRRDARRREAALARLGERVDEEHRARRAALVAAAPDLARVLSGDGGSPRVLLGTGPVPSGLRLDPVEEGDEALAQRAAVLADAPVTVPRDQPIAVLGVPAVAAAVRRALEAQGARVAAPAEAAVVLRADGVRRMSVLASPSVIASGELRPALVSAAEAAALPRSRTWAVPSLADLACPAPEGAGLPARFLVSAGGPVELDLVTDGPHAVVGGTTGSGKSELLRSWVVALTASRPAERLAVLLLDFKGGATFDPLAGLPQVAGVVSDLDDAAVVRLAASLGAEVRRRETALRSAGARDIDELADLPRLVIVVDEFAALLQARPELGAVVTDIAARGRALGMHLVLCTQRPAGVVRDALLANCGLRIALRMLAPEDSRALVGTPAAAELPRTPPGACLISRHGDPPEACRVALADPRSLGPAPSPSAARAAPVLLPPLPALVRRSDLPAAPPGALLVGPVDLPHEQRRSAGIWRPRSDGALLALGDRGSGRSTLLAALAGQEAGARLVAGGSAEGPETLGDALAAPLAGLLLVDDLDLAVGRMTDEYAADTVDRLALAFRMPGAGIAVTARAPLSGPLRPLGSAAGDVLLLRTGRDQHAALLGSDCPYDARLPPGGGWWRGSRIQIAAPEERTPQAARPETVAVDLREPLVVVSRTPLRRLAQLRRLLGDRAGGPDADPLARSVTVVGVDDFAATPALWSVAGRVPLVLDGCSAGEHRTLTRRRELPPFLAPIPGRVWLVRPEAPTRRATVAWEP